MCVCVTKSPCCAPEALWVNYTSIKYIYLKKYVSCFFFLSKFGNLIWSWRNLSLGFFSSKSVQKLLHQRVTEIQSSRIPKGKMNGSRIKQYRKELYWFFCYLRLILVTYYHLQPLSVLFCIQLYIVKPVERTSLLKTFSNYILFLIKILNSTILT